jgi:ribosomal protein S18 acetylase RimI-like enzyme
MDPEPSQIVVRPAAEADADSVAAVIVDALGDKYRPALGRAAARGVAALVRRDIRDATRARYWVAEVDGRIAGGVHLALADERGGDAARALAAGVGWLRALRATLVFGLLGQGAMAQDEAHVDELGVAGWARRRGVARALLSACREEASREGKRRLTLWVTIDNGPARALYERFGFREARRRRWLVGRLVFRAPGALLMELPLPPR